MSWRTRNGERGTRNGNQLAYFRVPTSAFRLLTVLAGAMMLIALSGPVQAQQTHLVVITGISGDAEHAATFSRWAAGMVAAAQGRWQIPRDNIVYLAEDPALDPARATGKSTRESIEQALGQLAGRARPDDAVLVLLIGHGSATGKEARFNLPGPDLTATEWARLLSKLSAQRVAVVNAASASGDFIAALSAKNRTVVTATRSGGEKNETVFAEYFVKAYAGDGADTDKDTRVSVLEAFNFARREVERFYQSSNRLQSEHAMLDDDGDGVGSRDPGAGGKDGSIARRFVLTAGPADGRTGDIGDSTLAPLFAARRVLEDSVAALREKKDSMDTTRYQSELERLLIKLAEKSQEIRQKEQKP